MCFVGLSMRCLAQLMYKCWNELWPCAAQILPERWAPSYSLRLSSSLELIDQNCCVYMQFLCYSRSTCFYFWARTHTILWSMERASIWLHPFIEHVATTCNCILWYLSTPHCGASIKHWFSFFLSVYIITCIWISSLFPVFQLCDSWRRLTSRNVLSYSFIQYAVFIKLKQLTESIQQHWFRSDNLFTKWTSFRSFVLCNIQWRHQNAINY